MSTNLAMSFIQAASSRAKPFQLRCSSGNSFLRNSSMSWAQRFFGLARARLLECFECTIGCQSVQSALHLAVSCVINLHAHFHFRERQVSSHPSWPAFLSCSSVQSAVRFKKSGFLFCSAGPGALFCFGRASVGFGRAWGALFFVGRAWGAF